MTFDVDVNGILSVTAKELVSGQRSMIKIEDSMVRELDLPRVGIAKQVSYTHAIRLRGLAHRARRRSGIMRRDHAPNRMFD